MTRPTLLKRVPRRNGSRRTSGEAAYDRLSICEIALFRPVARVPRAGHTFLSPARVEIAGGRSGRAAARRSTHTKSKRAGREATVVSRKKSTQPVASESAPPVEPTKVRPSNANEARSAY